MTDPVGITSFVLGLIDRVIRVFGWLSKKLGGDGNRTGLRSAVHFVPRRHHWSIGGVGNEPAMQLVSDWWVTNDTETQVHILRAELRFRNGLRWIALNQIQIMGQVPAGTMGDIRLFFLIVPPLREEHDDFVGRVAVIDNFNQRHKLGRVVFKAPKTRKYPD